jgi:hypothetical protein
MVSAATRPGMAHSRLRGVLLRRLRRLLLGGAGADPKDQYASDHRQASQ